LPSLIHLFGPDGAGKTTHMHLMVDHLRKSGRRARTVWLRSPHLITDLLWRKYKLQGKYQRAMYNPAGVFHPRLHLPDSGPAKGLWTILDICGVLPLAVLRVHPFAWNGYTLVAERYVIDSIVTLAFFLEDPTFLDGMAARLLESLLPSDTRMVFLDADYDQILKRRDDEAEPEEFIEFQRVHYAKMAKRHNALYIYTPDHPKSEVHQMIRDYYYNGIRS